jgi:hypothetical protein
VALVALATVATGNHYVFDLVCGLAVTAIGYTVVTHRPTAGARHRPPTAPQGVLT